MHVIQGILLYLSAKVDGDTDKLGISWIKEPPFVTLDMKEPFEQGESIFNSYSTYIQS